MLPDALPPPVALWKVSFSVLLPAIPPLQLLSICQELLGISLTDDLSLVLFVIEF